MYKYIDIHRHVHVCANVYTYVHAYVMYIHIYVHIYTYVYRCRDMHAYVHEVGCRLGDPDVERPPHEWQGANSQPNDQHGHEGQEHARVDGIALADHDSAVDLMSDRQLHFSTGVADCSLASLGNAQ